MASVTILCRCEDITEDEVIEAIQSGAKTLEELKRVLRVGMGPCQGRTCGPMLISLLSRSLKIPASEIEEWKKRPPLKPVPSSIFLQEEEL